MTGLNMFYEPIRAILGDFDTTVQKYSDTAIAATVRTVIRTGLGPGGYAISQDGTGIEPSVTDARIFGIIVYRSCVLFKRPDMEGYSYRTRALAESFSGARDFLVELEQAVYQLENGGMFSSFTNFQGWIRSMTGQTIWAQLTDVEMRGTGMTVSVGVDGIRRIIP